MKKNKKSVFCEDCRNFKYEFFNDHFYCDKWCKLTTIYQPTPEKVVSKRNDLYLTKNKNNDCSDFKKKIFGMF